jgi:hypothetical protein
MNQMNHVFSNGEPMPITSWTQARISGAKQYFTGVACKHGHVAPRDVSDRSCYTCKLAKSAQWKQKNPDKHAKINREWSAKNTASVGATRSRRNAKDPKKYWARSTFQNARKRAAAKNIPFELTQEDIYQLAGTHCPVFGTAFDFIGNGRIVPQSPSLDRIVPSLGYVTGNVAVISNKANTIKQNATADEIQQVADWLRKQ